jgi:hypothetical protein
MARHDIPELDTKGLRQFGLILGGILCVLFGFLLPWLWNWDSLPNWVFIGIGIATIIWALLAPDSMRLLYYGWMRIALLIGNTINSIILAIVFFVVITPMGLVMRMLGKDPLRRKIDEQAISYRVASKARPKNHMERPF